MRRFEPFKFCNVVGGIPISTSEIASKDKAPSPPTSEIRYQLSAEDIVATSLLLHALDPNVRKQILQIRLVLPLTLGVGALLFYWLVHWVAAISCGIAAIYFLFIGRRFSNPAMSDRIRKEIESGNVRAIDLPITLKADAEGIQSSEGSSDARIAWRRVIRVVSTGDCLLIYTGAMNAVIIPAHTVLAGDFEQFVAAVGHYTTIQTVKKGETFKEARDSEKKHQARQERRRMVKAFLTGAYWSSMSSAIIYLAASRLFPWFGWAPIHSLLVALPSGLIGVFFAVLQAAKLGQRDYETRCRKCQYILKSLVEPRCPECGERI